METTAVDIPRQPRQRHKLIILLRILVVLLVLAAVALSLAPTALSTQTGKNFVEGIIGDNLAGSLRIGSLSLSWFGGQRIEDVELLEDKGNSIRLQEFSTELTLWRALAGNLNFGKTTLRNLDVNIVVNEPPATHGEAGKSRRQAASHPETMSLEQLLPASLVLDAELEQGRITVTTRQSQPVVIDSLDLSLARAAPGDPLAFRFSGRSRQGELAGSIAGKGELHGMFGGGAQARAQIQIAVKDLPTDGVDGLFGLGGVLSAGLGPAINVELDSSGTARSQELSLQVDCANLTARLTGRAEDGALALTEAGTISATATPELVRKLATSAGVASQLRMTAPLPIQLTIDRLAFPVSRFDPSGVAIAARLEAGDGTRLVGLGGSDLAQLELRQLAAVVATDNLAKAIDLKLDSRLAQGPDPASAEVTTVSVNVKVSNLLDEAGRAQLDRFGLEGRIAMDGLSMALVDRLLAQQALVQELVGPRVDLIATSSLTGREKATMQLDIRASKLQVGTVAIELNDKLSLGKPVVVRTTVPKELFARLVKGDAQVGLRKALPVELTIRDFAVPRPQPGEPVFQPDRTRIDAMLTTGPLALSGVPQLGDVTAARARLSVRGGSLSAMEVDSSFEISQEGPEGMLRELAGAEPLKVTINASGSLTQKGVGSTDVRLSLESPRMVGHAVAQVAEGLGALSLKEALRLRVVVVPALLQSLALAKPGLPRLAGPATILVSLNKAHLPLGDSMAGLEVEGSSSVDRLTMEGQGTWSGASLLDTRMSFALRDGSGTARLEGNAVVPGQQHPGTLFVDAKVTDLFGEKDKASLDATAQLDGLPTAFVEALANQEGRLTLMIGPTLAIHGTVRLSGLSGLGDLGALRGLGAAGGLQGSSGSLDARVQSENLTLDAGLQLAETIVLSRPVKVRLVLTPDGYQSLATEASPLLLQEPATIEATIQSLRWPQASGEPRVVSASVRAEQVRFQNRATNKIIRIGGLVATAESTDVAKELQVKVAGNLDETGRVDVSLAVGNALTDTGDLNLEGLAAGLRAELRELPVAALDAWLGCDGLLLAALGKQLTLTATSTLEEMSGPFGARLEASQARGSLDCLLQDNVIRLNKPLAVELDATPKLGEKLLSRLHPFLKGIVAGTAIKLTVNKDGVRVPLADFGIDRLVVPEAVVDIGKVTLETDVVMEGLLLLAKRPSPKQLVAWFTPAVFSVRDGTVTFTKRMDILFDRDFHVATWGSADLRSGAYQQTLALTGPTLAKHFHLDNINPEEMFRIPVRGVAAAPQVDYTKAAADLARLKAEDRALSELTKKLKRVPAFARGLLEGQVKNAAKKLAGSLGGERGTVPPPSAKPLPWKR